jgi:hypothetical protein
MNPTFNGSVITFKDGRKVTVANDGTDFFIEFVNLKGDVTGFRLSREAAEITAALIQRQLPDVGEVAFC